MLEMLRSWFSRDPERVTFDDAGVTRTLPDGRKETVTWRGLRQVTILTTDEGPFVEDVFWLLIGDHGGCAVPAGAEGMDALLARLQTLPGFDHAQVIDAMGCTESARFTVWRR